MELKPSLSQINEIMETISAFANTKGGKIVIGISNSGKVMGVEVGKDTIERLTNKIRQEIDPKIHPRITATKAEAKNLIIIEVKPAHDKLVLASGRPFKRIGKSTVRMSKDEYEGSILEKHKDKLQFDKQICKGAGLKDIDEEKVRWFLEEAKRERKLKVPSRVSADEALMRLNLTEGKGKLTNASILLFGKDPQKYFLQAEVKCIRFKGNKPVKPFIDMRVINGNIIDQAEEARNFVLEHIPKAVWLAGKTQREERYQYSPDAIREAIVNAICHRNYEEPSAIQVRVFDDYLEIWNPGILPKPLTLADLKKVHKSVPRNPLIAKQFFWIKLVEEVGTGTNDMIDYCRKWGIPEPEFKHITGDFVVTFRGYALTEKQMEKLGLNVRQKRAVEYIREHIKINRMEYVGLNKVSSATAKRDLKKMIDKGILKSQGSGPEICYILSRYEPI